jgi:hypothetical protein
VVAVDEEAFRALARSSPWRWSTVQFVLTWIGTGSQHTAVRARVARPYGLRVEDLDGRLLQASWSDPSPTTVRFGPAVPGGSERVEHVHPLEPGAPAPQLRPDGLVARRPQVEDLGYDDPMFQDYRWVAMLDPVELADGSPEADDEAAGAGGWGRQPELAPLEPLRPVEEVDHGGRPAWQAVVRETVHYDPRCSCCPLLDGERAARFDAESGGRAVPERDWPSSWRVRLDVGTGLVVELAELGGGHHGAGFRMSIEEVDGDVARHLFRGPRPSRRRDRSADGGRGVGDGT